MRFLLALLFLTSSLFAERIAVDPSSRSFEMHPPRKERVDIFDFVGRFPELENIDINARKKKNVEFNLTGDYPVLKKVNYEGSFGTLKGELTGMFPQLSLINFLCTSCAMDFDLEANWQRSCEINIRGANEDVTLKLPEDVGLVIYTKTGLKGKVIARKDLKKQNRFGVVNKTLKNPLAETASVVLIIRITTDNGRIILN